jgi:hypothetical protein
VDGKKITGKNKQQKQKKTATKLQPPVTHLPAVSFACTSSRLESKNPTSTMACANIYICIYICMEYLYGMDEKKSGIKKIVDAKKNGLHNKTKKNHKKEQNKIKNTSAHLSCQ